MLSIRSVTKMARILLATIDDDDFCFYCGFSGVHRQPLLLGIDVYCKPLYVVYVPLLMHYCTLPSVSGEKSSVSGEKQCAVCPANLCIGFLNCF